MKTTIEITVEDQTPTVPRDYIRTMRKLKKQVDALNAEYKSMVDHVKSFGPVDVKGVDGGYIVYTTHSTKFNKEAFLLAHPEMAEEVKKYSTTSESLTFKFH